MDRPDLSRTMGAAVFRDYYYLKEELAAFCRQQGLPVSGSKAELTQRVARYLTDGSALPARPPAARQAGAVGAITLDTPIEPNFVCTEKHRAFFKEQIGAGFSFLVPFQQWLKGNPGKTYAQAVEAYRRIAAEKKKKQGPIGPQFEYNTYIRDFFADNPGKTLEQAIACWKAKKARPGHNRYEREDLDGLQG